MKQESLIHTAPVISPKRADRRGGAADSGSGGGGGGGGLSDLHAAERRYNHARSKMLQQKDHALRCIDRTSRRMAFDLECGQ